MFKKIVVWEAEYVEVAPELRIETVDAQSFDDDLFAQTDWEIDSIMREIGAR